MTVSPLPSALISSISVTPDISEQQKLHDVARQFEAIFVRQMLAAARKTQFDGGLFGGRAMQTFRQMQDDRIADLTAQTGTLGLATLIEAQLARFVPAETGATTSLTTDRPPSETREA